MNTESYHQAGAKKQKTKKQKQKTKKHKKQTYNNLSSPEKENKKRETHDTFTIIILSVDSYQVNEFTGARTRVGS